MLWIDIDQQGLDKQAERYGKKCASSTEDGGPDDQGKKTQGRREPNRYADDPRLDDRLDDEIQHTIDHDDGNRGHYIMIE